MRCPIVNNGACSNVLFGSYASATGVGAALAVGVGDGVLVAVADGVLVVKGDAVTCGVLVVA